MSLGFRLYLKRGILVSVCDDLATRLVTGTGFLGHALQYRQMRFHFRSWRGSGRLQRNLRVPTRSRSVGSHSLQGFYRSAVDVIALLLADRLSAEQRKAVGSTLALVGLVTTIPAAWAIFGKCE